MSLSCTCGDGGGEGGWYYIVGEDFSVLATKRSRVCCSCKQRIPVGSDVLRIDRYRDPIWDIESDIYGDEVPMACWYFCEPCGGLYMAVRELDMCCDIESDLKQQIREYNGEIVE